MLLYTINNEEVRGDHEMKHKAATKNDIAGSLVKKGKKVEPDDGG